MVMILDYDVPLWFVGILILVVSFTTRLLRRYLRTRTGWEQHDKDLLGNDECASPKCVRCSKTRTILERAQRRLTLFSKSMDDWKQDTLKSLAKDIDQSLIRVSSPKAESITDDNACWDISTHISTPKVFYLRGLNENSTLPSSTFPELSILARSYEKIRLEFVHLYKSPLPETEALWKRNTTESGTWEIVHLIDQGTRTKASQFCPLTMNIIDSLASKMNKNVFGNVAFSIVHPQTQIETHCGSTNCRIRCHLGLQVPSDCCSLTVDGTRHDWVEGGLVCFNDAFPHSVSHDGDETTQVRVVFMVDLWHPDVSPCQREMIDFAFSGGDR